MNESLYEVVVVGGGIVGLSVADALLRRRAGTRLILLEAEPDVAAHQTGHNSGVIHSGLYYRPGSLKAKNCVQGRERLLRFCGEHGIAYELCGKVVVATRPEEFPMLDQLAERGAANGLRGILRLGPDGIREREPHAAGLAGLYVPHTGIVDYRNVARALAQRVQAAGGVLLCQARVTAVERRSGEFLCRAPQAEVRAKHLVNCAGLQSDRVAELCGLRPEVRIVPFRGEYYCLAPACRFLVRNLIYPVPDPRFPFLGVHLTRRIDGAVEAGPNAVLAFRREGYRRSSFSVVDTARMLADPGFWRMGLRYGGVGLREMARSLSKKAFLHDLRKLLPPLRAEDLEPAGAGVRAQAVDRRGNLVDDFRIVQGDNMVHVLNAPSPAATACLSIGEQVAEMAESSFRWAA